MSTIQAAGFVSFLVRVGAVTSADLSIRVLIIDDHPLLRRGISSAINGESDMVVVGEAEDGLSGIEAYRDTRPDVTLMDLQMPGMNGVEAISAIREFDSDAVILVLTTYKGDVQAARALRAGASGYLLKSTLGIELAATIRDMTQGRRCIAPQVAACIAGHIAEDQLTPRETSVLSSVAAGHSNKRIAELLVISEETVKTHLKSILAKLGATGRVHAVSIAFKRGIIEP